MLKIDPTGIYKFADPAGRPIYAIGAWVMGARLPVSMEQAGRTILMISGHDVGIKEPIEEVIKILTGGGTS